MFSFVLPSVCILQTHVKRHKREHKAKEIVEFLYNNRETYTKQYLRNGSSQQSKKKVE